MHQKLCVLAVSLLAAVAGTRPVHAATLYGATGTGGGTGTLGTIDISNGSFTPIGAIQTAAGQNLRVTGLSFHPGTGVLYGVTGGTGNLPRNLITIDPLTALATVIGEVNPTGPVADIAFASNGTLYGWLEPSADDLVTISLTTGLATVVGDSGLGTFGSGLAFSPGGILYFTGGGDEEFLRTIDPATGQVTSSVALSGGNYSDAINALAFDPLTGILYGSNLDTDSNPNFDAFLIILNTTTGAVGFQGPSVARLDAIAFSVDNPTGGGGGAGTSDIPEPTTLSLVALAGAVLWAARGRIRS
jgi:WD40 repeat protein